MAKKQYFHCSGCQVLINEGRYIEMITADYSLLESHSHTDVVKEVHVLYFCASCAHRRDLTKVTHPDFEVRVRGWINCQKCGYETGAGENFWSVGRLDGVVDDRGIQPYTGDSLWVLCDKCGQDVDFSKLEVEVKEDDEDYELDDDYDEEDEEEA